MPNSSLIRPYSITFPALGEAELAYISVAEGDKHIPFTVRRNFWTYFTPSMVVRGRHAHYRTEQVLIAMSGRILVFTEMPDGETQTFVLEHPSEGVYIPPHCWHTMQYFNNATQLVLASTAYDAADYIRDYQEFKRVWATAE